MRLEAALDVAQENDISALTIGNVTRRAGDRQVDEVAIRTSNSPYPEQEEWIQRVYEEYPFRVIHIDNTGVGRSLADYIERNRHIRCQVNRVQGQGKVKVENEKGEEEKIKIQEFMSETFKRALQQGKYRMIQNEEARNHVLGVVKTQTPAGYLKYTGKKSDVGRDDHFWSKAMLISDWETGTMPRYSIFKKERNTTGKRKSRTKRHQEVQTGVASW
jgi:phage FluMu gp28-like protein